MKSNSKNKVLIVAYHFLPVYNAGVKRVLLFAKLLPKFDYHPFVLTTNLFGEEKEKLSFPVLRAGELLRLGKKINFETKRAKDTGGDYREGRISLKQKIKDLFAYPDGQNSWIPLAVLKGIRMVRKEKINLIFSTYPPGSSHLVGYLVSKLTGRPWVADFRDGFVFDSLQIRLTWGKIRKWLWKRMEKKFLRSADKVVVVTPGVKQDFLKRYPEISENKIVCITNGFDLEDFEEIKSVRYQKQSKFNLVHTGAIGASRSDCTPEPFFKALELFLKKNPSAKSDLKLDFYGVLTGKEKELVRKYGLGSIMHYFGQVGHQESLKAQKKADLLIIFDKERSYRAEEYSYTHMKVFEYLFSGRPILVIAPGWSPAGKYVVETKSGFAIKPEDTKEIAVKISELYQD